MGSVVFVSQEGMVWFGLINLFWIYLGVLVDRHKQQIHTADKHMLSVSGFEQLLTRNHVTGGAQSARTTLYLEA
jgi:hypothetical protein